MISKQLSKGKYFIKIDPDSLITPNKNSDCDFASLYFNIAVKPVAKISESVAVPIWYSEGFPDLSNINSFLTFSSYIGIFPTQYVKESDLAGVIKEYYFRLPVPDLEIKKNGITGL